MQTVPLDPPEDDDIDPDEIEADEELARLPPDDCSDLDADLAEAMEQQTNRSDLARIQARLKKLAHSKKPDHIHERDDLIAAVRRLEEGIVWRAWRTSSCYDSSHASRAGAARSTPWAGGRSSSTAPTRTQDDYWQARRSRPSQRRSRFTTTARLTFALTAPRQSSSSTQQPKGAFHVRRLAHTTPSTSGTTSSPATAASAGTTLQAMTASPPVPGSSSPSLGSSSLPSSSPPDRSPDVPTP